MDTSRYQAIRRLAAGGMAEVFLARVRGSRDFSKTVALKRILREHARDPSFVTMFVNEAHLSARLNHPHIVQTLELSQTASDLFLVMEYVDGPSLRDLLIIAKERSQNLPAAIVLKIVSQICEALAYAHGLTTEEGQPLKLIHRDVSPENVLLTRTGLAKLSDFGVAKAFNVASAVKTEVGVVKGKASYLAPELILGRPFDHRIDIFALGVVLYESLAGVRPFLPSEAASVHAIIAHQPLRSLGELRPDLPPRIVALVDRALAKDPAERTPDAHTLQREIEHELHAQGWLVLPADIAREIAARVPPGPPIQVEEYEQVSSGAIEIVVDTADQVPTPRLGMKPRIDPEPIALGAPRVPRRRHLRLPAAKRWAVVAPWMLALTAFASADTPLGNITPPPELPPVAAVTAPPPVLVAPLAPPPVAALAPAPSVVPPALVRASVPPTLPVAATPRSVRKHVAAVSASDAAPSSGASVGLVDLIGPAGLRITLDGRPFGVTPVGPLPLTAGPHHVGFAKADGEGELIEVSVSPGDRASIRLDVGER